MYTVAQTAAGTGSSMQHQSQLFENQNTPITKSVSEEELILPKLIIENDDDKCVFMSRLLVCF